MLQRLACRLASDHEVPSVFAVLQAAVIAHSIVLSMLQQCLNRPKARTVLLLSHMEASLALDCQGQ